MAAKNYFIAFDLSDTHNENPDGLSPMRLERHSRSEVFSTSATAGLSKRDWPAEDVRLWLLGQISPSWHGIVIRITDPMFGQTVDPSDLPEWLLIKNEAEGS